MMLAEFTYGIIREVEPNIMEIIINEGVELSSQHIEQIELGLLEKYSGLSALLVNRVNSYSHTHESMQKIPELRNIAALAVVVYSDASAHAAKLHGLFQDNVQVFDNKESALVWLRKSI